MAARSVKPSWTLRIPGPLWRQLKQHLFPGDKDEHGAIIAAGVVTSRREIRLLVRHVYLAQDGRDYVKGDYGYRKLTAEFVRDHIMRCRDEKLAYLTVHCHGGSAHVSFSRDEMAYHERGYPALRDIANGQVVGALVFAAGAVAGDLWLPDGTRSELSKAVITDRPLITLYDSQPAYNAIAHNYDRQARLFGDRGQAILGDQKVGIIGAGGAGSLIIEYLARLGVGHLVVVDPDRIDITNLPRVVGAKRFDALSWLTHPGRPEIVRRFGKLFSMRKVKIAKRLSRTANPRIAFQAISKSVVEETAAKALVDCDYIFLAADSMQARLVFNAIVHQFCIPGVEVGAKVPLDRETGAVLEPFSVVRPVWPNEGCLWCNELISPSRLQEEAISEQERRRQKYVDDPEVVAPSVITLNAVAAAHAVNDYLFNVTGLLRPGTGLQYSRFLPRTAEVWHDIPRRDDNCRECSASPNGRLSRGETRPLPTK